MSDLSDPGDPSPAGDPSDPFHRRLHHITPSGLSAQTAQTSGMRRVSAISAESVGSSALWMGQTHVTPSTRSGNHHHGASETGIYVVSGHPEFVFLDDAQSPGRETRLRTSPGDYVYVPPWVPHREENPDPDDEAVVIIARTTQEAIVINLSDLQWVGPQHDDPGPATTGLVATSPPPGAAEGR